MTRVDGRSNDQLRKISIEKNFTKHAEGSVLVSFGDTKVICTASVDEKVPPFLRGKGEGWVTAEYAMLPRATNTRVERDRKNVSGRTIEIQRLIGRALRAAVDFKKLGERSILIDCDVIQADGGTRTAAITGAFVALRMAVNKLMAENKLTVDPIIESVAAVSVGIIDGEQMLDLAYVEDSKAEVDMNIIMTASCKIVEIQGTAEHKTFERSQLNELIDLGEKGIKELIVAQNTALA